MKNKPPLGFVLPLVVSSLVGFSIGFLAARQPPPSQFQQPAFIPEKPLPSSAPARALGRLLAQTPKQIDESSDIAVLNLACLAGLPGTENVDLDQAARRLDYLANEVRRNTEQSLKTVKPHGKYTLSYHKTFALISTLQELYRTDHQIYKTSPQKEYVQPVEFRDGGWSHPEELFFQINRHSSELSGLHNAVLFIAVGRRLGYPLKLVETPERLVARWESPDGKESFDLDSFEPDSKSILEMQNMNPLQIALGRRRGGMPLTAGLKSLTPAEEFALFLRARGQVLASLDYAAESRSSFASAYRFAPQNRDSFQQLASGVDISLARINLTWKELEEANADHFNLELQKPKEKDVLKKENKR